MSFWIGYNATKKIDFNKLGGFNGPLSEFALKTLATTSNILPEGYRPKVLHKPDIVIYLGPKGLAADWAEIITYYPILIFMFIFVAVVFIVGLIVIWCWCRHRMKKKHAQNDQAIGKPRSVGYAVVSLVLLLIIFFCSTIFWSISGMKYEQKVKNMRGYIEENCQENFHDYYFASGWHCIVDVNDERALVIDKWSDLEKTKIGCLPKLENAMTLIKNINNNINSMSISSTDWIDKMRFLHRDMIFRLEQSKESENFIEKLRFRTFYYFFQNLNSMLEIESTMDKLEHIIIKLINNVRPNNDISAEVDRSYMNKRNQMPKKKWKQDDEDEDEDEYDDEEKGPKFDPALDDCLDVGGWWTPIINTYRMTRTYQYDYLHEEYVSLPFLGYFLILLICICALLGVICDAVTKPRCNFFFVITICMITLFSAVILVSVLWHFFFSAVMYADRFKYYFKVHKKRQGFSDIFDSSAFCDTLMEPLKLDYIKIDYHTMSAYVNSSGQHKWSPANTSACQLTRLRRSSNTLPFSEFAERSEEMKEDCKRLHEIFEGNFSNFVNKCQKNRQTFKSVYFGEINEAPRETLKLTNEPNIPKVSDDVSVIRWLRVLGEDYPVSIAAVWVPIFITVLLLPLLIWPLWFLSKHPVHIPTFTCLPIKRPKERKKSIKTAINQPLPVDGSKEEVNKEPAPSHPPNASISRMSEVERKELLAFIKLTKEEAPRLLQRYSKIFEENKTRPSSTEESMPSPTHARNSNRLSESAVDDFANKHMVSGRFVFCDNIEAQNKSIVKRPSKSRLSETSQTRDKPFLDTASSTQEKLKDCSCKKEATSRRVFSTPRSKQPFSDRPSKQLSAKTAPRLRSNSTAARLSEPRREREHSVRASAIRMNRLDIGSQDLSNHMCRALCNDLVTNIIPTDRNTLGNENSNLRNNAPTQTLVACQARKKQRTEEDLDPPKLRLTVSMQCPSKSPRQEK